MKHNQPGNPMKHQDGCDAEKHPVVTDGVAVDRNTGKVADQVDGNDNQRE